MLDNKLLLVDDHKDSCANLSDILSEFGYTVDIANCGEDGFDLFKGHPYRLVLLDLKLPDMTGVELFKRMRQVREGIQGFLVTAYASLMKPNEAKDAGFQHVLEKPVDVPNLVSLIQQALA